MHLINEGVGPQLNFTGLYVVTIQVTNSTFNIYNFYSGKHLMAWKHYNIKKYGHIGPLVFLKVDMADKTQGGLGVLWMYFSNHLAVQFIESLYKLVASFVVVQCKL